MRYVLLAIAGIAVLLSSSIGLALQSENFDPVENEVASRQAELPAQPDKSQKKLAKTYKQVQKLFAKDSTSVNKDLGYVSKIVKKILKPLGEDETFQDLIGQGLGDYQEDLQDSLDEVNSGIEELSEGNKKRGKAEKDLGGAQNALDAAMAEPDLTSKSKLLKKAASKVGKAEKSLVKAEKKEGGGGPNPGKCPGEAMKSGEFFAGTVNGMMFAPGTVDVAKNTEQNFRSFTVYNCGTGQMGRVGISFPDPIEEGEFQVFPLTPGISATWSPDPNAQFVNAAPTGTVTISNFDSETGRIDGAAVIDWSAGSMGETDHLEAEFTIFLRK